LDDLTIHPEASVIAKVPGSVRHAFDNEGGTTQPRSKRRVPEALFTVAIDARRNTDLGPSRKFDDEERHLIMN